MVDEIFLGGGDAHSVCADIYCVAHQVFIITSPLLVIFAAQLKMQLL